MSSMQEDNIVRTACTTLGQIELFEFLTRFLSKHHNDARAKMLCADIHSLMSLKAVVEVQSDVLNQVIQQKKTNLVDVIQQVIDCMQIIQLNVPIEKKLVTKPFNELFFNVNGNSSMWITNFDDNYDNYDYDNDSNCIVTNRGERRYFVEFLIHKNEPYRFTNQYILYVPSNMSKTLDQPIDQRLTYINVFRKISRREEIITEITSEHYVGLLMINYEGYEMIQHCEGRHLKPFTSDEEVKKWKKKDGSKLYDYEYKNGERPIITRRFVNDLNRIKDDVNDEAIRTFILYNVYDWNDFVKDVNMNEYKPISLSKPSSSSILSKLVGTKKKDTDKIEVPTSIPTGSTKIEESKPTSSWFRKVPNKTLDQLDEADALQPSNLTKRLEGRRDSMSKKFYALKKGNDEEEEKQDEPDVQTEQEGIGEQIDDSQANQEKANQMLSGYAQLNDKEENKKKPKKPNKPAQSLGIFRQFRNLLIGTPDKELTINETPRINVYDVSGQRAGITLSAQNQQLKDVLGRIKNVPSTNAFTEQNYDLSKNMMNEMNVDMASDDEMKEHKKQLNIQAGLPEDAI